MLNLINKFPLLLIALAACESKPMATSHPAAAAQTQPGMVDTTNSATVVALSRADTVVYAAPGSSLASDAAASTKTVSPMEDSKTVAPGLVVYTKGVPVTDGLPTEPQRIFLIKRDGRVLYADTTADFIYPTSPSKQRYPLWLPTAQAKGELLVRVASPPDLDIVRRFLVNGPRVTRIDTLPAFDEAAKNLDKDLLLEFSGYQASSAVWDDDKGHYWTSYNPKLYYEIRPTGLVLDSALTKQKAIAQYGVFRGFTYSEKPGISIKKP
jgi:hypothetical protein